MKIEVGMYVRTLKGIAKIVGRELKPDNYYFQCWITDRYLCICDDTEYLCDSDILKASHNIIDLIEVGDYVNGYKVINVGVEELGHTYLSLDMNEDIHWLESEIENEEQIKSIVTKEQFESMSYKVGGLNEKI